MQNTIQTNQSKLSTNFCLLYFSHSEKQCIEHRTLAHKFSSWKKIDRSPWMNIPPRKKRSKFRRWRRTIPRYHFIFFSQITPHRIESRRKRGEPHRQSWELSLNAEMALCVCFSSIRTRPTVARRAWVACRVRAEAAAYRRPGRPDAAAGVEAAAAPAAAGAAAPGPDKAASRPAGARPLIHGRATPNFDTACCSLWSTRSIRSTTVSPAPVYQLHTLSLSLAAYGFSVWHV